MTARHSAPLVGAKTWNTVMDRAGGRCQCTGACGNQHTKTGLRCDVEHGAQMGRVRLIVAPADLTLSPTAAARVPAGELRAWCPTCHAKTATRQRAADRERERSEAAQAPPAGLFDLPASGGAEGGWGR
jgi:hypothetical protein